MGRWDKKYADIRLFRMEIAFLPYVEGQYLTGERVGVTVTEVGR